MTKSCTPLQASKTKNGKANRLKTHNTGLSGPTGKKKRKYDQTQVIAEYVIFVLSRHGDTERELHFPLESLLAQLDVHLCCESWAYGLHSQLTTTLEGLMAFSRSVLGGQ